MAKNKVNLRDLIAATGLVILLKFDPNHRFFSPCDLEIWWMTSKNYRATLPTSSFVHFKSIGELKLKLQSGNAQFGSKLANFLSCVTLKFDGWPWKTIWHLFYTTSSFVHHFKATVNSHGSYSPEMVNSGQNRKFFVLCDLKIWRITLKNNRAPLLSCFKLCASFHSHQ